MALKIDRKDGVGTPEEMKDEEKLKRAINNAIGRENKKELGRILMFLPSSLRFEFDTKASLNSKGNFGYPQYRYAAKGTFKMGCERGKSYKSYPTRYMIRFEDRDDDNGLQDCNVIEFGFDMEERAKA